ncbi:MAG: hypothetical protein ACPG4T_01600 [Nannocystaceae bacterium]
MQLDFTLSETSRMMETALGELEVGGVVSYEALERAGGRSLNEMRGAITTARRRLLKNEQRVFACIRGEGYKRLSDSEIVKSGQKYIDRSRRTARKCAAETMAADFDKLTDAEKVKHNAQMAMALAISELSTTKSRRRLEAAVEDAAKMPTIADTLKHFLE